MNLIWEEIFGTDYTVQVWQIRYELGKLIIFRNNDENNILFEKSIDFLFRLSLGPQSSDINAWQEICSNWLATQN